jgi:sortase (surface protein transpeptidase)
MTDQIAAKLTPDEWAWLQEVPQTLATCDQLVELNQRLIRWAKEDPRKGQDNLYVIIREIERLIGP